MNFYAAATPSVRVRSSFPGPDAEPYVQFGSDAPIPLPTFGLTVVARDVDDDTLAVMVGLDDHGLTVSRRDRSIVVGPIVHGPYGIQIEPDGVVSWVRQGGLFVDYADGRPATPCDARHPLAPDMSARDVWEGIPVVPQPAKGGWQIAEDGSAPEGQTRIFARLNGGPVLLVFDGYTPVPASLTVMDDGGCVVSISLPKDEATFFVESSAFARYERPEVEIPDFPWNPNRCAVVMDGEPGYPWFLAHNYRVSGSGQVLGIIHHVPQDNQDIDAHEEMAREHQTPFYNYADTDDPNKVVFAETSVPSLPMVQCYPLRGETDAQFEARTRALFAIADREGLFGVYGCGFLGLGTDGVRGEQQLINGLWILGKVRREFRNCRIVVVFTWNRSDRLRDGLLYLPNVLEAARRLQYSVAHPDDYPTVAELRPAAQPEPPRQPSGTPMPKPKPTTDTLQPDQILSIDEMLWSPNRRFRCVMQSDGNLVLYDWSAGDKDLWSSQTMTPGTYAIMQSDGNLVLYNGTLPQAERKGLWDSQTSVAWSVARLSDAGKLEIVSPAGEVIRSFPSADVPAQPEPQPPAPSAPHGEPSGSKPQRVSGDARLEVRGNFCNLWDDAGRIVYTPALPGTPDDVFADWMRLQREAGSTHVFFGPPIGGAAYPGVHWPNPNYWDDLPAFRRFVEKVLDTPAADGKGFRPVIFVGGDTFGESHFDRWHELAAALDGLHEFLTVLPAWEPVIGGWSSAEVSRALIRLHELLPDAVLGCHGSPTRWVSSSNPVEADDPWAGAESGFFKRHGGEHIDIWFYQTQHGRELYAPCTCPDSPRGEFTHAEECFLNRWEDGVARLGTGHNGWRVLPIVLYETVAYEAFRGQATHADARRIAAMGKKVADKWGVSIGFGNGLP